MPKNFNWRPPEYQWIIKQEWIPEKLGFIITKTAHVPYDRDEINRKFNKILLQELTIDAD